MKFFQVVLFWGLAGSVGRSESTEQREWTSVVGSKITAVATAIEADQVKFTTTDGKLLSVPLDKLVEADRTFLMGFFKIEPPKPGEVAGSGAPAAEGLPHPLGEIAGPVVVSPTASYMVYLPKSLKKDRKAPLVFITSPVGGNKRVLNAFLEGSELGGWIAAISMESKNGHDIKLCQDSVTGGVGHITANLPVDPERVYFAGTSGGAAMAFRNANQMKHAGVIASVGYIPDGAAKVPKGGDYFIFNGATDYNRYTSAYAANTLGDKNSILRYNPEGHVGAPPWMTTEAVIWLNIRYLSGKGKSLKDERSDFEERLFQWLQTTKTSTPHRAYHAALQMKDSFGISPANAPSYQALLTELGTETNRRYAEGILEMDKWARKNLGSTDTGSKKNFTTPEQQSAAKALSKKLAGVPELEEIALKLGEATK